MLDAPREPEGNTPRASASKPWQDSAWVSRTSSRSPREKTAKEPWTTEKPRRPTKMSVGVILCRKNQKTGRLEALLVRKRFTYSYAEFIHGRYVPSKAREKNTNALRDVATLLNNMTREELLDVWSLNFAQMWYRAWLFGGNRDLYNKKAAKFQTMFMRDDGGAALRRMVTQARANGEVLWEAPKGRRLHTREGDVFCAVRELREETGVDKNEYRILPGVKRRVNYVSVGVRYTCVYYIALANPNLAARQSLFPAKGAPALRDMTHMAEIGEACWKDIEQIRALDEDKHLASLVAPAFTLVKKYLRGKWAHALPDSVCQAHGAPLPRVPADEAQATSADQAPTQATDDPQALASKESPTVCPSEESSERSDKSSEKPATVRPASKWPKRPTNTSQKGPSGGGGDRVRSGDRVRGADQQRWPRAVNAPRGISRLPRPAATPVDTLNTNTKREKAYKPRGTRDVTRDGWRTVGK